MARRGPAPAREAEGNRCRHGDVDGIRNIEGRCIEGGDASVGTGQPHPAAPRAVRRAPPPALDLDPPGPAMPPACADPLPVGPGDGERQLRLLRPPVGGPADLHQQRVTLPDPGLPAGGPRPGGPGPAAPPAPRRSPPPGPPPSPPSGPVPGPPPAPTARGAPPAPRRPSSPGARGRPPPPMNPPAPPGPPAPRPATWPPEGPRLRRRCPAPGRPGAATARSSPRPAAAALPPRRRAGPVPRGPGGERRARPPHQTSELMFDPGKGRSGTATADRRTARDAARSNRGQAADGRPSTRSAPRRTATDARRTGWASWQLPGRPLSCVRWGPAPPPRAGSRCRGSRGSP